MRKKEVYIKMKSVRIVQGIKNKINSKSFLLSSRTSSKFFTRERKLHFPKLIIFLLNLVKKTMQKELTQFISQFSKKMSITKSAFTQQRSKLKPKAFIELNDTLVYDYYREDDYKTWNGFRLLAIDGSALALPKSDELRNEFGVNNDQNKVPMAKISCFYDLLNEVIIDSCILSFNSNEYSMAVQHLEKATQKDLIIFDRGYGARWLFYLMFTKGIDYLVRLQRGLGKDIDAFWASEEATKVIEINELTKKSKSQLKKLGINYTPFKLRLVKVILDSGEIEVLVTSLIDEIKFPAELFRELYFKKWSIETNYNHLKNHLEIGDFTGLTTHAIMQDFYANTFIANLQSVIINEAQEELDKKQANKQNKYMYKINKNLSLAHMKDKIVNLFIGDNKDTLKQLKKLFLQQPVPVRKGRKYPRVHRKKNPYSMVNKRAI